MATHPPTRAAGDEQPRRVRRRRRALREHQARGISGRRGLGVRAAHPSGASRHLMRAVESEARAQYLFIVARNRHDILTRVRERLRDDVRIDVIVDRRHGERRQSAGAQTPERRRADRRRPTRHWDDLSVYPTLVVQKRAESWAELRDKILAADREAQTLRDENARLTAENARLRDAIVGMERRVEALVAADALLKADAGATLAQAEEVIGSLLLRFRERLNPPPRTGS